MTGLNDILKNQNFEIRPLINFWSDFDGDFSIDTRLKLIEVVGPISRVGSMYNLQPTLKRGGPTGMCRPLLLCLS